jgi:hypothetical protein
MNSLVIRFRTFSGLLLFPAEISCFFFIIDVCHSYKLLM